MGKFVVVDHPLVQHKVTMMRDKTTNTRDFKFKRNNRFIRKIYGYNNRWNR